MVTQHKKINNVIYHSNRVKGKRPTCISIDAKKALEKNPFMIKALSKVRIEGKFLHMIKGIYEKPTSEVTLSGEKVKVFSPKPGQDKDVCFHHYYSISH